MPSAGGAIGNDQEQSPARPVDEFAGAAWGGPGMRRANRGMSLRAEPPGRTSRKAPVPVSTARRSLIIGSHKSIDGEESTARTTSNQRSGAGRVIGVHRPVFAMKVAVASSSMTRRRRDGPCRRSGRSAR